MRQGGMWKHSKLIGRVLDSRPRGRGFEHHPHHCVVSLSKTHLSLLTTRGVPEGKIKVRRGWVWEGVSPSHTLEKKSKI